MTDEELATEYNKTIEFLKPYTYRQIDGTFTIALSKDEGKDLNIEVVHNLLRSIAHTNYLIKEGILDPSDIEY